MKKEEFREYLDKSQERASKIPSRRNGQTYSAADLVPELQRRIEQLERALDKYGVHGTWCMARNGDVVPAFICTCGLDAARKGTA